MPSEPTVPSMRRRDFLYRVGALGGAGALYHSMDALGLVASTGQTQRAGFSASLARLTRVRVARE